MLPARIPLRLVASAGMIMLTLALGACSSPPQSPPAATAELPTEVPVAPDATAPSPGPEIPVREPEPPRAPPTAPRVLDPAAAPVVALLAKQLRLPESQIMVEQVARAEWPNACLGLPAEGEICAQMLTPGFAVSLIANGERYDFRTDVPGKRIRLAFAPRAELGEPLLTWRDSASFSVLTIGSKRIAFGVRGQSLLTIPLPIPERAEELSDFLARFADFYARTPAGEISMRGVGETQASALEQRQIAEWARLVAREAREGLEDRVEDRAFVWRREGGIAGFCDEVIVSRSGLASARSCREDEARTTATVMLTPAELELLYRWLDEFGPLDWEDATEATADELTLQLQLDGQGARPVPESERERMLEFAHTLVRRLLVEGRPIPR